MFTQSTWPSVYTQPKEDVISVQSQNRNWWQRNVCVCVCVFVCEIEIYIYIYIHLFIYLFIYSVLSSIINWCHVKFMPFFLTLYDSPYSSKINWQICGSHGGAEAGLQKILVPVWHPKRHVSEARFFIFLRSLLFMPPVKAKVDVDLLFLIQSINFFFPKPDQDVLLPKPNQTLSLPENNTFTKVSKSPGTKCPHDGHVHPSMKHNLLWALLFAHLSDMWPDFPTEKFSLHS